MRDIFEMWGLGEDALQRRRLVNKPVLNIPFMVNNESCPKRVLNFNAIYMKIHFGFKKKYLQKEFFFLLFNKENKIINLDRWFFSKVS